MLSRNLADNQPEIPLAKSQPEKNRPVEPQPKNISHLEIVTKNSMHGLTGDVANYRPISLT